MNELDRVEIVKALKLVDEVSYPLIKTEQYVSPLKSSNQTFLQMVEIDQQKKSLRQKFV